MSSDGRVGATQQQMLAELRRKMAAVPGRGESAVERVPDAAGSGREVLPVPAALAALLPDGGLAKGSVIAYTGARSLLAGMLAAVTAAGGHAAVVGVPRFGLLAAAEMGADLERLAVVADPGPDPLEIASVLLDGLDLVVLGLDGGSVAPARARVLAARARNKGATLVVADGAWPHPALRIDARIAGYVGLGTGHGRLHSLTLEVEVRGKAGVPGRGHLDLRPTADRVRWFTRPADSGDTELFRARGAAS
ncbi:hypothetical protein ACFVMC_01390 [Nocardia sp. NPDC127579]|uniref:hypothetical protein n=1 Tax=Nocardia sp. NPDC127579 TaxID=3345402 RepID=UPI00364024F8